MTSENSIEISDADIASTAEKLVAFGSTLTPSEQAVLCHVITMASQAGQAASLENTINRRPWGPLGIELPRIMAGLESDDEIGIFIGRFRRQLYLELRGILFGPARFRACRRDIEK